jgi:hypothetical protein
MRKENTAVKSPPVDTSMSIEVGQLLAQRRKMRKENTAVKSPPVDTSMSIEVGQLQLFVSRLQVQRV